MLTAAEAFIEAVEADHVLSSYPAVAERLNMVKEVIADVRVRQVTSKDPDARIGHTSKTRPFFGFKTHMAMTIERIITAATRRHS